MKSKLDALKAAKSGSSMSPVEKDAKMSVIQAMRDMAQGHMGDRLKGLKKVTVASDDPEGLKAGLDKAKQMLGKGDEEAGDSDAADMGDSDGSEMEDESEEGDEGHVGDLMHQAMNAHEHADEGPEMASEDEHMSEDELDAKLQQLMKMKERMKSRV
jgi:hypothetical protein